jgi:hypothetical protein
MSAAVTSAPAAFELRTLTVTAHRDGSFNLVLHARGAQPSEDSIATVAFLTSGELERFVADMIVSDGLRRWLEGEPL